MKIKLTFTMLLLLLAVLFTLQNTEMVDLKFFFWDLSVSRALLLFLVLSAGILIGFFLGSVHRKKTAQPAKHRDTPSEP